MQVLIRTDRLLVEQMESPDTSEGGIILPDQSKVKQAWATVLQMGPDVEDIEVQDRIAFADFSGVNVELDTDDGKKDYLILSQDDVLLILRESDTRYCPSNEEQGLNEQELDIANRKLIDTLLKEPDAHVEGNENQDETEQGPPENTGLHGPMESCGSNS